MAEALVEDGIGEARAALVGDGEVIGWRVEREGGGPQPGAVWDARLVKRLGPTRAIVRLGADEALIVPPAAVTEGALVRVEVTRAAMPEAGRPRLPKARPLAAAPGCEEREEREVQAAPGLAARLAAEGHRVVRLPRHGLDRLEALGWSEALDAAADGRFLFPGGRLTAVPTPAMTVIDVDGDMDIDMLAVAGAAAAARAIRLWDLGGSVAIDLPTTGRTARQAAAEAFDRAMGEAPFERTAVNGFGLLHVVRPRARPSLLELSRLEPVATAALRLLRSAERTPGAGPMTLAAAPAVAAWIAARPGLVEELQRRTGRPARLEEAPALSISGWHVS